MSFEPGDIISDEAQSQAKEFGFEAYAKTIADIIAKKKNTTPMVIGIYGPWDPQHARVLGRSEPDNTGGEPLVLFSDRQRVLEGVHPAGFDRAVDDGLHPVRDLSGQPRVDVLADEVVRRRQMARGAES